MIVARELMKLNIPVISFDMTVPEAITYMSQNSLPFAVVATDSSRLNGVITEAVLMKIYLRYQSQPEKESMILYREFFEPVQLILEEEDFSHVVKKLMTAIGNRGIVVNQQGKAIGYITAKDVLPYFSENFKSARGGVLLPKNLEDINNLKSDLYLYETFFTKSPFLMHSVNLAGVIQMANESMHAVLGYEYGSLVGKTAFDIYPPENHDKVREALKGITHKGFQKIIQGEMVRKDGKKVKMEMMTRALCNEKESTIGTITVSRPQDMEFLLNCLPHHS